MLFATGRAELNAGGVRRLEPLGRFLKDHPQRQARIEGYTDSTGSPATNLELSRRRAEADSIARLSQSLGVRVRSARPAAAVA